MSVETIVSEAIYKVLVEESGHLETIAVQVRATKCSGGYTAACEVVNFPDVGTIAKWNMEISDIEPEFDSDDLVDDIREVMGVMKDEYARV